MAENNLAEQQSKHGAKFDEMLCDVQGYSMAQVMCLEDEVTRKIIIGIVEGSRLPEVQDAFRILYEDYPPIRLAGNLLFDMIGRAVESCPILEWDDEDAAPTEKALLNARNLFAIADADGSGALDQNELRAFLKKLNKVGWTVELDEDRIMSNMEKRRDVADGICFAAFASGAEDLLRLPEERQDMLISQLSDEWKRSMDSGGGMGVDKKQGKEGKGWSWGADKYAKYNKRFEDMIITVGEWRGTLSKSPPEPTASSFAPPSAASTPSRLQRVLKGSLIGAGCPSLVEALRCVYVEYAPLRMGGDLIFKILKNVYKPGM